jgi:hypothetical protein
MSDDKIGGVIVLSVTGNTVIYNFVSNPFLGKPKRKWY